MVAARLFRWSDVRRCGVMLSVVPQPDCLPGFVSPLFTSTLELSLYHQFLEPFRTYCTCVREGGQSLPKILATQKQLFFYCNTHRCLFLEGVCVFRSCLSVCSPFLLSSSSIKLEGGQTSPQAGSPKLGNSHQNVEVCF